MKIQNPLDQYVSHSIHYVLLATNNTEDLRLFSENSAESFLSAVNNTKTLGGEIFTKNGMGKAFLVLDTRRFSQYMVENVNITTKVAGINISGGSPSSIATDLTFDVLDSTGISFANYLQWIMDARLKTNFDGLNFLFKVFFIGHRTDGTTETIQSVSLPAFITSIEFELTDIKGIYKCKLIPVSGFTGRSDFENKWLNIGNATSFFTGVSGNTLGNVIGSFERRLNEESIAYYSKQNKNGTRIGRPCQYVITLPGDGTTNSGNKWSSFPFNGPAQNSASEVDFVALLKAEQEKKEVNNTPVGKDSHVSIDSSMNISKAIDFILKQCPSVIKLGNFTDQTSEQKEIVFYKQFVSVTSDSESFTVHIDIVEFKVPNVLLAQKSSNNTIDTVTYKEEVDNGVVKVVPRNSVEYDYYFSGKNIDVISLDLKMQNLAILISEGTKLGSGELYFISDEGQKQKDGTVAEQKSSNLLIQQNDPIVIPMKTKEEKNNYSNYAVVDKDLQRLSQQYTVNLSNFLKINQFAAKMVLRGNPNLLSNTFMEEIPNHVKVVTFTNVGVVSKLDNGSKAKYRDDFETRLMRTFKNGKLERSGSGFNLKEVFGGQSFATTPLFMKVNVYGPNVDFLTQNNFSGEFSKKLFYDNYYLVDEIVNSIDSQGLKHEVSLRSYSVFGKKVVANQDTKEVK